MRVKKAINMRQQINRSHIIINYNDFNMMSLIKSWERSTMAS